MSVIVVVRVMSNHFAVIVTVVFALTGFVVTGNASLGLALATTVSAGTWTSAGLLVESCTFGAVGRAGERHRAGRGAAAGRASIGMTETADSDGPAGRAGLTDRFAERGVLSDAGGELDDRGRCGGVRRDREVRGLARPRGRRPTPGTVATEVSPLNSSTVVGPGSGNAS